MKLLIITQKVDIHDDVLGFMHGWIAEFAKHCKKVTVICLYKGEYNLPDNVEVLSLGKEKNVSKLTYLFNFYRYIISKRKEYDSVFVHMNHIYIILGSLLWKLWNKNVGLWYAHGHVPMSLRLAHLFIDTVFTSTATGYRISSPKIRVIGQGINTDSFIPSQHINELFSVITIGRISPVKDYETLISAIEILYQKGMIIPTYIVGGAGLPDQIEYFESLKKLVAGKKLTDIIYFVGPVSNNKIVPFLQKASIFANMSHTGSLDKAGLEAMAVGIPILTCNEAYTDIVHGYKELLMYSKNDAQALASKIEYFYNISLSDREKIGTDMRKIIIEEHSLTQFIKKITTIYHNESLS